MKTNYHTFRIKLFKTYGHCYSGKKYPKGHNCRDLSVYIYSLERELEMTELFHKYRMRRIYEKKRSDFFVKQNLEILIRNVSKISFLKSEIAISYDRIYIIETKLNGVKK